MLDGIVHELRKNAKGIQHPPLQKLLRDAANVIESYQKAESDKTDKDEKENRYVK